MLAIAASFAWLAGALLFLGRLVALSVSEPAALPPLARPFPAPAE